MHRDVIHTVAQIWTRPGALPHRQVQKEGQQATWYYHSTFSKFADASKWADAAQVLKAKGIASAWPRLSWTLSWHCHDTVMIMPYIHFSLWWACRCVLLHIDRVYAVIAEGWNGKPHPIAEVLDRMLQGHFWLWRRKRCRRICRNIEHSIDCCVLNVAGKCFCKVSLKSSSQLSSKLAPNSFTCRCCQRGSSLGQVAQFLSADW